MDLEEFQKRLKGGAPSAVAHSFIKTDKVAAFPTSIEYKTFLDVIAAEFPAAEKIHLVGSGNWGFSLDPNNLFRPFGPASDLDVAIISTSLFTEAWDKLRMYHRTNYYLYPHLRDDLRRNGENVYSGFVAPDWIPQLGHEYRYDFLKRLNRVEQVTRVTHPVSALYFRNITEWALPGLVWENPSVNVDYAA